MPGIEARQATVKLGLHTTKHLIEGSPKRFKVQAKSSPIVT